MFVQKLDMIILDKLILRSDNMDIKRKLLVITYINNINKQDADPSVAFELIPDFDAYLQEYVRER